MPVAEEQAPPRMRCMAVHIATGRAAPGGIDSVVLITRKNMAGFAPPEALSNSGANDFPAMHDCRVTLEAGRACGQLGNRLWNAIHESYPTSNNNKNQNLL
jgi:hypothetical protein